MEENASITLAKKKNHRKQLRFLARIKTWTTIRELAKTVVVADDEERRMAS